MRLRAVGANWRGSYQSATASAPFYCSDLSAPGVADTYEKLLPELWALSPRFGHADMTFVLPCVHWPYAARRHPAPRAKGAAPILVVGGVLDAAAPYEQAETLAGQLESGVLLTREGMGHVRYNPCVIDTMSAYLVDLTVPPDGTRCPKPPRAP